MVYININTITKVKELLFIWGCTLEEFRILLVEDEIQTAMFVETKLIHEKYKVDVVHDGKEALRKAENIDYELILLDIMIPSLNGIEVCKQIREFSCVPIIIVSAKSDIADKVLGLDAGANDYLTKPFAMEELLARIRVYQRSNMLKNKIKVKDIIIDNRTHQVFRKNKEIQLTKKEYDLLKMLLINKNIVLTREQLIEEVWGYEYIRDTNVVDVFIRYLRSKIDDGFEENLITTVRGVGYVIKSE